MLTRLLLSDALPLVAVALLVVEGMVLGFRRRRLGQGPHLGLTLSFLASGMALMTALFFHRRPGGAEAFGVAMTAALLLHGWHLARLPRT